MNFYPSALKLNKKAQKVVGNIDEILSLYKSRHKEVENIHLYKNQYKTLNDGLLACTKKKISLKSHSYRGVMIQQQ